MRGWSWDIGTLLRYKYHSIGVLYRVAFTSDYTFRWNLLTNIPTDLKSESSMTKPPDWSASSTLGLAITPGDIWTVTADYSWFRWSEMRIRGLWGTREGSVNFFDLQQPTQTRDTGEWRFGTAMVLFSGASVFGLRAGYSREGVPFGQLTAHGPARGSMGRDNLPPSAWKAVGPRLMTKRGEFPDNFARCEYQRKATVGASRERTAHVMGRISSFRVSIVRSLLSATVAIMAATPLAAAENEVSGTFTVNGKATKFSHAYTYWKPNFFDAGKQDLFVLFSDVPLAPEALPKNDAGVGKIGGLVRDGKVHALELHLSPATRQLDSAENAAVYHIGLSPGRYGMSGMHVFEATTFSDTLLEGKARTDGPQESDGAKWSYDVTFKVHLAPPTTPAPRKRAS